MSDLRSRVIRLAHANPELRPALLPLLKEAAAPGDEVARSGTAKSIAKEIGWAAARLESMGTSDYIPDPYRDAAKISPDFRKVEDAYRSTWLKKDRAYRKMIQNEIARARKKVDDAIAPYKSQIADVRIYDGEKSESSYIWIYIEVTLK